ncbi:MAG: secondary thiamine-phosphate synthase enzyme YjbQ [Nanoarchaeota archaeon]|nr:secondary thiamine-phosphate synthase enzyme YjbQ [Nanoarchaeota archaeon]
MKENNIHEIILSTKEKEELVDITEEVKKAVTLSKVVEGICVVYAVHSTAAIMINENADVNLQKDVIKAINKMVLQHDNYAHDKVDDNAAAHIKATLIGPSKTVPIIDGELTLGSWQDIFLFEFDGPRKERRIIVQIISQ